jgi:hypothetical protein
MVEARNQILVGPVWVSSLRLSFLSHPFLNGGERHIKIHLSSILQQAGIHSQVWIKWYKENGIIVKCGSSGCYLLMLYVDVIRSNTTPYTVCALIYRWNQARVHQSL